MLNLKKVAVTGGLACGKSTVCSLLRNLGAYTVSADLIVHQLLSSDLQVISQVVNLLGPSIILDHQLDRSKIASAVFNSPSLLESLEALLHPHVKRMIEEHYMHASIEGTSSLFVAEIPLLFEAGNFFTPWFDIVICVVAKEQACRERWKKDDFDARSARQWPIDAKAAKADIVIDNSGNLEDLQNNIQAVFSQMTHWQKTQR